MNHSTSSKTLVSVIFIFCFAMVFFISSPTAASDWELIGKKKIQKLRPAIFNVDSTPITYSRIKLINEAGSHLEVINLIIQYTDKNENAMDIQSTLIKEENPFIILRLPASDKRVSTITINCRSKNRSLLSVYAIKD